MARRSALLALAAAAAALQPSTVQRVQYPYTSDYTPRPTAEAARSAARARHSSRRASGAYFQ